MFACYSHQTSANTSTSYCVNNSFRLIQALVESSSLVIDVGTSDTIFPIAHGLVAIEDKHLDMTMCDAPLLLPKLMRTPLMAYFGPGVPHVLASYGVHE